MDIQYKVGDASEFIPTVAWLGLKAIEGFVHPLLYFEPV
jgi:hypothetical protein